MASPQFLQVKSESSQEQTELIDLCVLCFVDEHEDKIDLIPGMYRHEDGQPWVMPFVLNIEKKIIDDAGYNHEYVIFLGLRPFTEMVPQIVLGKNNPVIQSGRAFAVQTVSGTAALRAGGELLARHANFDTFYLSDPTWDNHEYTFLYSGLKNSRVYRYWDPVTKGVDFKGMIEDLMQAPENSIIVLQMCSHNPTGCDLTKEQWIKVADVMEERKLFPFFDAAYQGFSTGDLETDAWPVRYFVDRGFELFIAQTFSKNMGLYSDRVGSLIVVLKEGRQKEVESIKLMLTVIIRALYLCPTKHGAEIVIQTLKSPELYKEWLECLKMMVKRLKAVRQGLKDRLVKLGTPGNWDHITEQTGMFSFTGLSGKQVAYLAKQYHIYLMPNGRANMCALNMNNLDAFAKALHNAVINIPA
ncbi:aspartate aminotransferase, cytoplasmic-like [Periplaneta americana]|uniref:aspartate aminotransferase, cytoplasmic-like n=1 Tax=Periplaneta americana TaxID=6978 RepID=UPI0037E813BF